MKKEDFKKGQTVWVYRVGNSARQVSEDERVEEWEVTSVGRKYITAKPKNALGWKAKFDIDNGFCQKYDCCEDYKLFLSKNDAEKYIWESAAKRYITQSTRWGMGIMEDISSDDLRTVYEIFQKYDKTGRKYHE